MKFLDPFPGTNWELPPRRSRSSLVWCALLLLVASAFAAHVRAADAYVSVYGAHYGCRVYAQVANGDGTPIPWDCPVEDVTATTGGSFVTKVYRATIPQGKYTLHVALMSASGSWDIGGQRAVEISASSQVWVGVWYGTVYQFSYGVGIPNVGDAGSGPVVPPSSGGGGSADTLSAADAADVFRNGFFTGLGWELCGLILAVVRRIRSGTGMEG